MVVSVAKGGFEQLPTLIGDSFTSPSSWHVLADGNTAVHCYPAIQSLLPEHRLIEISAGEGAKNLQTCQAVWGSLLEGHADRNAVLVCLGGGMITDLGGFCASVYKRGIKTLYLPTSLMAMADAAIGGKTGIDHGSYKNILGTFALPTAVYIFPQFLNTLPIEEVISGYAEIVKHGLLQGGRPWASISSGRQIPGSKGISNLLEQSIAYKQSIVNQDPFEDNIRKVLNLGHTAGHAIESWALTRNTPVPHGNAVAAGLVVEARIANEQGKLAAEPLSEVVSLIQTIFPKVPFHAQDIEGILEYARQDKKNSRAQIRATLLCAIGKPEIDVPVQDSDFRQALEWYRTKF